MWNLDKNTKKLNLIEFYDNLRNALIFNINYIDYDLIGIELNKFSFYKIFNNHELKEMEEITYLSMQPCNQDFSHNKIIFAQNKEFCFILINNYINIYKMEKNKIKFKLCYNIESNLCFSMLCFKTDILFGCNSPCLYFLPIDENNENIEELEYYLSSENDKIFDIKAFKNEFIILGNKTILQLEIQ